MSPFSDAAILIVDDQEANIDLLVEFLRDAGYTHFTTTTNSRDVLGLYQETKPDLILLDLHMPHFDGFAVLQQLREHIAIDEYLPILVLTADITSEAKQRALAAGPRDFLTKPLDEIEVQLRIENLLETRLLHRQLHERNAALQAAMVDVQEEREKSERLLLNVLPASIAQRLKADRQIIADSFAEATVLFADIVGFTGICARLSPEELIDWLNGIFSLFDQLAAQHGLEKIKTIGDSYMVAGGIPSPRADHADAVAEFAIDMRDAVGARLTPSGERFGMRIGIHTGQVVAGVIGKQKFSYDLWGETVNIASRMEAHGIGGSIQVSEATWERLRNQYRFTESRRIALKDQRTMRAFILEGRRSD